MQMHCSTIQPMHSLARGGCDPHHSRHEQSHTSDLFKYINGSHKELPANSILHQLKAPEYSNTQPGQQYHHHRQYYSTPEFPGVKIEHPMQITSHPPRPLSSHAHECLPTGSPMSDTLPPYTCRADTEKRDTTGTAAGASKVSSITRSCHQCKTLKMSWERLWSCACKLSRKHKRGYSALPYDKTEALSKSCKKKYCLRCLHKYPAHEIARKQEHGADLQGVPDSDSNSPMYEKDCVLVKCPACADRCICALCVRKRDLRDGKVPPYVPQTAANRLAAPQPSYSPAVNMLQSHQFQAHQPAQNLACLDQALRTQVKYEEEWRQSKQCGAYNNYPSQVGTTTTMCRTSDHDPNPRYEPRVKQEPGVHHDPMRLYSQPTMGERPIKQQVAHENTTQGSSGTHPIKIEEAAEEWTWN